MAQAGEQCVRTHMHRETLRRPLSCGEALARRLPGAASERRQQFAAWDSMNAKGKHLVVASEQTLSLKRPGSPSGTF